MRFRIINWVLCLTVLSLGGCGVFGQPDSEAPISQNTQAPPQKEPVHSCKTSLCLNQKIKEAQETLSQVEERHQKLKNLFDDYSSEYQSYYDELKSKLPSLGIRSHEELLRQCEPNFQEVCNLLERTAILQNYINSFNEQITKCNSQINQLKQIIWKLEKILQVGEFIPPEEQEKFNQSLISSKAILAENVDPSDRQNTAQIQQDIFNRIISESQSYNYSPNPSPTDSPSPVSP